MTHLIPLLKFIVPVAGLTVVGGGVYFIGGIVPKKDPGKPLPGVYLLVKGSEAQETNHNKPLTKKVKEKTVTDYFCKLTLPNNKTLEDKSCALFNINKTGIVKEEKASGTTEGSTSQPQSQTSTTPTKIDESIDFYESMFKPFNLTTAKDTVTATSHHILKVNQDFYYALIQQKEETNKAIKLVDSTDNTKHFGSVKEVVKLNLKTVTDIKDPRVNLFLARVKEVGTSLTGNVTSPLSCQLDKKTSVKCNIFTLETASAKTNHLTKTKLSNLTALSSLSGSTFTKDNYVVVQLLDDQIRSSELKNKAITINQIKESSNETVKLGEFIFDQLLIGQIASTASSSTIFPISQKRSAYLVEKTSTESGAFTGITGGESKNYKCKFTVDGFDTYDNSCTLQNFPSDQQSKTYTALTTSTTQGFTEITSSDSSNTHFLLTLDSNKLYNLRPNCSKEDSSVVVVVEKDNPAKTMSFKLQQELKVKKAIGKTNLAFVKYKSSEQITSAIADGKCALVNTDSNAVSCSVKKATMDNNLPKTFAEQAASQPFTTSDYFAIKFDEFKNIKDFDGNEIYFYTTESSQKKKVTFDIIATMGGDIASNKSFYFLEKFRSEITTTTSPQT